MNETMKAHDDRDSGGRFTRRAAIRAGGASLAAAGMLGLSQRVGAQSATPAATPAAAADHLAAALAALDGIAQDILQKTNIPGMAISVVAHDQMVYAKGFGMREVGRPEKVDTDTVFQLASLSKPIAATVVAGVVGDGKISWDSRMAELDPSFQLSQPFVTNQVTLKDLFAHRSGLADHAGDLLEDIGYDRAEVLHRLRFSKPEYSFRAGYAYTNFGLTGAAVAAADSAGMSWEDLSAAKLYQPLGMTSTSSRYADFVAAKNRARGHILVDGKYQVPKNPRDPDAQSPAGGVSSSVRDMAQWLRLQLAGGKVDGKQIIDADALAETHRPQAFKTPPPANPAVDRAGFYGLGWNVSYPGDAGINWGHSGAFALGAATAVYVLPASDVAIVVLTNAAPIGAPEAVALSFLDFVQFGAIRRDWLALVGPAVAAGAAPLYGAGDNYSKSPASPTPALANAAYIGTYTSDYIGDAVVAAEGNGLVLKLGPKPMTFPLRHYDRDLFLYQPVGENAGGLSAVTFTVGADGKAEKVVLENFDVTGEGTFTAPTSHDGRRRTNALAEIAGFVGGSGKGGISGERGLGTKATFIM